jgi:hypothetical protein
MSTLGTSAAIASGSRCARRGLLLRQGVLGAAGRIHSGRPCRQEPKLKDTDTETWAMPSPSSEAGPSRQPTDASSDLSVATPLSAETSTTSPATDTPQASSSKPSPLSRPKSLNRLPKWIPPHWQTHLEPDAQWRKELLSRRKRLAKQAGQQLTGLGLKLNEVTGYKEVERLKDLVGEKGES